MTLKMYGASDDLFELEGTINEEFNVNCNEPFYVGISDGTLLKVEYDDNAIWRIHKIRKGDNNFTKIEGDVEQDTNDIVSIAGEISWVLIGLDRVVKKQVK